MKASCISIVLSTMWVLLSQLQLVVSETTGAAAAPAVSAEDEIHPEMEEDAHGSLRARDLFWGPANRKNGQSCGPGARCAKGLKCLFGKQRCTNGNPGSLCSIHADCDSKKCQQNKCQGNAPAPAPAPVSRNGQQCMGGFFQRKRCGSGLRCIMFLNKCSSGWNGSPCIMNGDCKGKRTCQKNKCRAAPTPTESPTPAPQDIADPECPCWDDLQSSLTTRLQGVFSGQGVTIEALTTTAGLDSALDTNMHGIHVDKDQDQPDDLGDPAFIVMPDGDGHKCKGIMDGEIAEEVLSEAEALKCKSDIRDAVKVASETIAGLLGVPLETGTCPCEAPRDEYAGTVEVDLLVPSLLQQELTVTFGDATSTTQADFVKNNGETITCDAAQGTQTISKAEFGHCAKPVLDAM